MGGLPKLHLPTPTKNPGCIVLHLAKRDRQNETTERLRRWRPQFRTHPPKMAREGPPPPFHELTRTMGKVRVVVESLGGFALASGQEEIRHPSVKAGRCCCIRTCVETGATTGALPSPILVAGGTLRLRIEGTVDIQSGRHLSKKERHDASGSANIAAHLAVEGCACVCVTCAHVWVRWDSRRTLQKQAGTKGRKKLGSSGTAPVHVPGIERTPAAAPPRSFLLVVVVDTPRTGGNCSCLLRRPIHHHHPDNH